MFQLACVGIAVASFFAVAFVPAWRELAAAVLVATLFLSVYVAIVRRPRALAVAFLISLLVAPFMLIFGIVPVMIFGAPLAWYVADRLFGRPARAREAAYADALRRSACRLDERAESVDSLRMNAAASLQPHAELVDYDIRIR
jgi:hypothetical protein